MAAQIFKEIVTRLFCCDQRLQFLNGPTSFSSCVIRMNENYAFLYLQRMIVSCFLNMLLNENERVKRSIIVVANVEISLGEKPKIGNENI